MAAMKPTPDPYRVLGILRGADAEAVKAAHRRLAKAYFGFAAVIRPVATT